MIRYHRAHFFKPEARDLREHLPFKRNALREHHVESRETIRRHN